MKSRFIQSLLILLLIPATLFSQEKKYYFYHPEKNYGSDLVFSPMTLMISGSFDILRNDGGSKDIFDQDYQNGFRNVMKNITHPIRNIKQYGWGNFGSNEILNFKFNPNTMQFLPNYTLHVFGNGMQYVKLAEWYDYRHIPHPYLLSALTTISYQFINEVVENGKFKGPNVDPIADMLIFNPIGFTLFSTEFGRTFFSTIFPIYDWSCQSFYNPDNHFLENTGQQFATKILLPRQQNWSLFVYWGVQTIFGMSYNLRNHDNISFGVGSVVNDLKEERIGTTRLMTPYIRNAVGIFYDRNNSLLASAIISGQKMEHIRIELFPGLAKYRWFNPGLFVGISEWDKLQLGMTATILPVGIIHNFF